MFKLTIECANLKELTATVAKLGDSALSGTIEASTPTNSGPEESSTAPKGTVTKKELIAEAEARGLEVNSRSTKAEIEKAIESAKTGRPAQPTQPEPVPQNSVPQMSVPQAPAPQAPQAPAPQAPAQPAPQPTFHRDQALQEIVARLGTLSQAGVPEDQIMPAINNALQAVGAPLGTRLSQQSDQHLSAAYSGIVAALDSMISQGQQAPSQFV